MGFFKLDRVKSILVLCAFIGLCAFVGLCGWVAVLQTKYDSMLKVRDSTTCIQMYIGWEFFPIR
jgi:hypothetical protein